VIGSAPGRVARCPACARRFPTLPLRRHCTHCGSGELTSEPLAAEAVVLARTEVHRSQPGAVFQAPYEVVHVRESLPASEPRPAAFNCPLYGEGASPATGETVSLRTLTWQLESSRFEGTVALRGGAA
jgi:hypothetical protein